VHATGRPERQHGTGKPCTTPGLRAETPLAPQDGRPDGSFGRVVGGLDPGDIQIRPEGRPQTVGHARLLRLPFRGSLLRLNLVDLARQINEASLAGVSAHARRLGIAIHPGVASDRLPWHRRQRVRAAVATSDNHEGDGFAAAILALAARYLAQYMLRMAMYNAIVDICIINRMEGV